MFIEFVTRSWCTFFSLFPLKPVFYKVQLVHVQKASWKVTYKSNKCRSLNHTPFQSVSNIFSSLKIHLSPNIPLLEKKPENLRQRISPTLTPNQNLLLRFFFSIFIKAIIIHVSLLILHIKHACWGKSIIRCVPEVKIMWGS